MNGHQHPVDDLPTQEVDSAIAGFEPGSQPPKSAAEILLATLAQVLL